MRGGNESRFLRIVSSHLFRYPLMQCADLYKLLHQAAMGSSHGLAGVASSRRSLYSEIDNLSKGPPEPMLDVISDDGLISRINLRPYLAAGGDPDSLLEAFIRTSLEHTGTGARLEKYRGWVTGMMREDLLPEALLGIDEFMDEMYGSGYPAVHHSEVYGTSYSPAYRVILSELVRELSIFPGEAPNPYRQ
ncbi:MAG: hypothetical protein JXA64_10515 [Candidatus Fermentibacteraceae bacterium]|nr:hypothetical protein [Candidatus Fermentibacteraceae bacterium]